MGRSLSCLWIAAVLLLTLSTPPAGAGYRSWTSQGPDGGSVSSLVVTGAPGTLFASVINGVMKSVDGGRTWRRVLTDSLASGAFSLAVSPADPETLYAGGREALYKTSDGGASWRRLGLSIRSISKVVISPLEPNTVWVAGAGFYVSRDAGVSWSEVAGGFPPSPPEDTSITRNVVLDPTQAGVVYASNYGSHSGGLFKTVDGGAHWSRILSEAPAALAIDAVHPWKLYAGGLTTRTGILRSLDSGATWAPLDNATSAYYIGVLAVNPVSSAVYAATGISAPHGVFRSLDGGETWADAGASLPSTWPHDFAFDPGHPETIYFGSSAGVWKSVNRGRTWTPSSSGMAAVVSVIAVAPSDTHVVYAGSGPGGLFRSTNRGETWSILVPKNLNVNGIWALVVDPAVSSTVFAATDRGLFKSLDQGETWRRLGALEPVYDLAIDPAAPSTLYAATWEGAFRSTDGGATWSLLWPAGSEASLIHHLAVSPARPASLYLACASGLFTSSDRGETWAQLPFSSEEPLGITVDPLHPATLYVSGERSLHKSTDGGVTWTRADYGIPSAKPIATVIVDPFHPNIVYCATWGSVFQSTDGAATWRLLGSSFEGSIVTGLALGSSETTTLHTSTYTGVFELTQLPPPPPGDYLTTGAFPGFRFKVLITNPGQPGVAGRQEPKCTPNTLCVSGAVRGRTDVRIRLHGPRPDGTFSVSVTRLTRAQVEVWVERPATGDRRYYLLAAGRSGLRAGPGEP